MFTIYNDSGSDSTMVSNLFIDEYMKSANDAQIKVYLYLLRMMGSHRAASVSEMADHFNHTEKDVVRSLRYWERKGLLALDFGGGDSLISIRLCRPGSLQGFASDNTGRSEAGRVLAFSMSPENPFADSGKETPYLRKASGGTYPARTSPCAPEASGFGGMPVPSGNPGISGASGPSEISVSSVSSGASGPSGTSELTDRSQISGSSGSPGISGFPVLSGTSELTGPPQTAGSPASSETSCSTGSSEMEALESFRNKAERAQLLFVIEQYIGKPLSLNEIRIVYNISEQLGFSDDLIDYLFQYCLDRGKKDFRYIRKVAENWAETGVMTPAQAEQAVAQDKEKSRTGKVRGSKATAPDDALQTGMDPAGSGDGKKRPAGASPRTRSANSFNQFEQNKYDFDALEEELLQSY